MMEPLIVATTVDDDLTFEASLAELEQIVRDLEEGNLPLSDSLARYETGVTHLRRCYELLERAGRRIELLQKVDAEGNPITRPFDAEATYTQATDRPPARGTSDDRPGDDRAGDDRAGDEGEGDDRSGDDRAGAKAARQRTRPTSKKSSDDASATKAPRDLFG